MLDAQATETMKIPEMLWTLCPASTIAVLGLKDTETPFASVPSSPTASNRRWPDN